MPLPIPMPSAPLRRLAMLMARLFRTETVGAWRAMPLPPVPSVRAGTAAGRRAVSTSMGRLGLAVFVALLAVPALHAQRVPDPKQGEPRLTQWGILDGNRVRTLYSNYGEIARYPDQPSGEWPKGSGHSYVDGVAFIVSRGDQRRARADDPPDVHQLPRVHRPRPGDEGGRGAGRPCPATRTPARKAPPAPTSRAPGRRRGPTAPSTGPGSGTASSGAASRTPTWRRTSSSTTPRTASSPSRRRASSRAPATPRAAGWASKWPCAASSGATRSPRT